MTLYRIALLFWLVAAATTAGAQPVFTDAEAVMQFQRAADAYAFHHRQVQRRLGEAGDRTAMATAMRAARPSPADGGIFTPVIGAALRARIGAAINSGCKLEDWDRDNYAVPRPNDSAATAAAIPDCLRAGLPRLPEELEYRRAGVSLVLVDTHADLVVDVLHGAFR